jgi:hypothetical protein
LDDELEALGGAGGEHSTVLERAKIMVGGRAAEKDWPEEVGGGYGVLNGQVDAYAADGGHGMGGVANAEESGAGPLGKAVDRYG